MIYKILLLAGAATALVVTLAIANIQPTENKIVHTTERGFTSRTLAQEAELVVIGSFTTSRSYLDTSTGQRLVLTEWQFIPSEVLKGTVEGTISVTLQGGRVGKVEDQISDAPEVRTGQKTLLYLTKVPLHNTWLPVSTSQGILVPTKEGAFVDHQGEVMTRENAKTVITDVKSSPKSTISNE